jgi:ATP-dependent exoDNAse (exonuclease V) alpha subunit
MPGSWTVTRPLATAPTGITTVSLEAEGFEEVATCDRLLADLDRGREQLDDRTVLVVDEAGMLGSRKLTRLLEHAEQAQAKVVLVGDDRQLASIDAGGGFRALRLRLGASGLTENRRQHQAWEREAPWSWSAPGWWRRRWPPTGRMTG